LICVENTYPPVPAQAGRKGARFFVNITSEGEVGGVVQEQLLRICMLRAVENRIAYVRCGNTGISGFIDPEGRVRSILRGKRGGTISVAGTLVDEVPLSKAGTTPYARSRDAFAWSCIVVTALLFLGGFARARRVTRAGSAAVAVVIMLAGAGCSGPLAPEGDPAAAPLAVSAAAEALAEGDTALAARAAASACAAEDSCGQALPIAFRALIASPRLEDAADFFDAVGAKWPSLEGDARAYAGLFLERSGDLEEALARYGAAVKAAPSAAHWALVASLEMKMQRNAEAVEAYREAVRAGDGDGDERFRYGLARALHRAGDVAEARAVLEALVSDRPDQANAWALLGSMRLEEGDDPGARAALASALAADPKHLEARLFLARIALREGDLATADRIRRDAAEIEASLGRGPRED
jgi:tetratricopeptide (TPR) repeat protein